MKSDELRQRARNVFEARVNSKHLLAQRPPTDLIAEIPSGPNVVLRIYWTKTRSGIDELKISGWERGPDGMDVPRFGLQLRPIQLPIVAMALATALDDLEAGRVAS
jgi:hypothetical protein